MTRKTRKDTTTTTNPNAAAWLALQPLITAMSMLEEAIWKFEENPDAEPLRDLASVRDLGGMLDALAAARGIPIEAARRLWGDRSVRG